jgi:hypothetical protein
MGDRYVTAYLSILSLMLALVIGLANFGGQADALIPAEVLVFSVIICVGAVTFKRMMERRKRSIEYLRAINRIHKYFCSEDEDCQQYLYWPADDSLPPMAVKGTSLGGLRDIVAILNSLSIGVTVGVVLKALLPVTEVFWVVALGIAVSLVSWYVHAFISRRTIARAEEELAQKVTKA